MTKRPRVGDTRPDRRHIWLLIRSAAVAGLFTAVAGNLWIALRAHGRIFTDARAVPATEVAIVLGTASELRSGDPNPFFAGRMKAAAELYRAGKVRRFLLSGARHSAEYNEPGRMRAALIKQGVPDGVLTLDEAGFRTLDSFARAKQVFGITRAIIVTDDFHAPRSILLARHFGIDAQAYCWSPVPFARSKQTRTREIAARARALLDLYVLRTQPLVLGAGEEPRR